MIAYPHYDNIKINAINDNDEYYFGPILTREKLCYKANANGLMNSLSLIGENNLKFKANLSKLKIWYNSFKKYNRMSRVKNEKIKKYNKY